MMSVEAVRQGAGRRRHRAGADRLRDRRDRHAPACRRPPWPPAIADRLGADKRRRVRHLGRLRRLLLRRWRWPRTWSAAGQRRVRAGDRRGAAVRPDRPRRPRHRLHLRRRRRRGRGRPVATRPGIGPVVWGSEGEQVGHRSRQTVAVGRATAGDSPARFPACAWRARRSSAGPSYQMAKVAQQALDAAGITADDLDAFIPHQANMRIIDAMVKALELPEHVPVARDIAEHRQHLGRLDPARDGADARRRARRRTAALALLIGFGAGPGVRRAGRRPPLGTPLISPSGTASSRIPSTHAETTKERHTWPPPRKRSSPTSPRSSNEVAGIDERRRPAGQVLHRRPGRRLAVHGRGRRGRRGEVRREDPGRRRSRT